MLQNVRFSGVVVWRSSEQDSKHVVHVLAVKVDVLGASHLVGALVGCDLKEWNFIDFVNSPLTINHITDLQVVRHPVFAPWDVLADLVLLASGRFLHFEFS